MADEEKVEGATEAVDVGAQIDRLVAARLLGADVVGRPDGDARVGEAGAGLAEERLGETEVAGFDYALRGGVDVARLDVAVDDLQRVRGGEGAGEVAGEVAGAAGALILTAGAAFSILGNAANALLSAPRVLFALGVDGLLPNWFGRVHARDAAPADAGSRRAAW